MKRVHIRVLCAVTEFQSPWNRSFQKLFCNEMCQFNKTTALKFYSPVYYGRQICSLTVHPNLAAEHHRARQPLSSVLLHQSPLENGQDGLSDEPARSWRTKWWPVGSACSWKASMPSTVYCWGYPEECWGQNHRWCSVVSDHPCFHWIFDQSPDYVIPSTYIIT